MEAGSSRKCTRRPYKDGLCVDCYLGRPNHVHVKIGESNCGWPHILPPEMWFKIVTDNAGPRASLDLKTLAQLQLVCKHFYHLVNHFEVWKAVWISTNEDDFEELIDDKMQEYEIEEEGAEVDNEEKENQREDLLKRFIMQKFKAKGGAWLKGLFAAEKIMKCHVCGGYKILEMREDIMDFPLCSACVRPACEECVSYCSHCEVAFCNTCNTPCASCQVAQHCDFEAWRQCESCTARLCPACTNDLCPDCMEEKEDEQRRGTKRKHNQTVDHEAIVKEGEEGKGDSEGKEEQRQRKKSK